MFQIYIKFQGKSKMTYTISQVWLIDGWMNEYWLPQVNNCVIDWLTPWPEEALHSVATVFLSELDIPDEFRPVILSHIVMVHMSVCKLSVDFVEQTRRTNYVTPKNFLDYIDSYRVSLTKRRTFNITQCKRLEGGLSKIAQAKVEVAQMQVRCLYKQENTVPAQPKRKKFLLKGRSELTSLSSNLALK